MVIFNREFKFTLELKNKVFFFFSFQVELNSTSFFPSKELAEATETLLDSLGTLAVEVSCLSSTRSQTIHYYFSGSEFG